MLHKKSKIIFVLTSALFGAVALAGQLDTEFIKDNAITADKIAAGAVTSTKLGAGSVGSSSLESTAVTPGSYTNANVTVDAYGRVTSAANGSAGAGTVTNVSASSPLSSSGGTTPNLSCAVASDSQAGCISSTDHAAFAAKQPAGSYLTSTSASSPLSSSGGLTPDISCAVASDSQAGCISSTDHAAFAAKQAAGSYITALTGEVTASGPGSVAATVSNSAVIGKVLTGYTSGAGTVAATDSILGAIQKLNGNVAAIGYGGSVGDGIQLFFNDTASDIGGYFSLPAIPAGIAEDVDTGAVIVGTSPLLMESYATSSTGLQVTTIKGGVWQFNTYASVSATGGISTVLFRVYKRTSGGTETLLFSVATPDVNDTASLLYQVTSVQPSFSVNTTDRLVVKVYATTDSATTKTISFYHDGTDRASYIRTPLTQLHNALGGIQGGSATENYHLTNAEHTVATQAATDSLAGYLSAADHTTFAAKLTSPLTTKGDILGFSTVNARLPVGTNGQVITADSTQALGIKWAAPTASGATVIVSHTITAGEVTAKSFSVASAPTAPADAMAYFKDGVPQLAPDDFTITGTTVDWNGLGLDGIITAGMVMRLVYN